MPTSFLIAVTIIFAIFASLGLESAYAEQEPFVLLYTFDEGEGDIAKDLSSEGNDGKVTDAKWTEDGKFGRGLEFNGTSTCIEVPHDASLDPGGDQITVMAWYKPLLLPGGLTHPAIAVKAPAAGSGWRFEISGGWGLEKAGSLRGLIYVDARNWAMANGGVIAIEQWNHMAMVYNGKRLGLYLNGESCGSVEILGDINKNEVSMWISREADGKSYLHGIMDELAILNVALTEAQIKEYMEGGLPIAVEASGKLAISWGEIKIQ